MSFEGHVGLSNEKAQERTVGTFQVALSYLKKDQRTAYFVIHAYSNTYDIGPHLQRTNLAFGGYRRGGDRKNFLQRLGFRFSDTCNVLDGGRCYFAMIEEVDRDEQLAGGLEHHLRVNAIHERFRKFADGLEDLYNKMKEVDRMLFDAGFELPWEDLKLAPVVFAKDEKVYAKGQVYDFYTDIRDITQAAKNEVLVIDAYANEEVIDLYLEKLPMAIKMRILTKEPKDNFMTIAQKFKQKPGVRFEARQSQDVHDRLFFIDNTCWVAGQSIKDAGKKPTYLVRLESHDVVRRVFEDVWTNAKPLI
jgi:hypothetical protein